MLKVGSSERAGRVLQYLCSLGVQNGGEIHVAGSSLRSRVEFVVDAYLILGFSSGTGESRKSQCGGAFAAKATDGTAQGDVRP